MLFITTITFYLYEMEIQIRSRFENPAEKKLPNPEKELKVSGGWFQASDILEFCFYGKLESLD